MSYNISPKKECPRCHAETEGEFLRHDKPRFDGTGCWMFVCWDCDLMTQKEITNYDEVMYLSKIYGWISENSK